MAKRAGFWLVCCIVILVCLQNLGCTSAPAGFHGVTLTPSTPQTIGAGTTLVITAAVSNDTSGAGVTWGTPAHGTLSGVTTTSATYNAPAVPAGQSVTDAVTATSVAFPGQSKSLSITVEGAPLITTTSLPGGNWGSPYSATVSGTGGVPPFAWSISAGSLTTGLSLGASTTSSVMISGTPGAQVDSNFTIKMTDSSGAFATQALTIAIGAPLPLQVTTTSLPNGALNVVYPSTALQASGGVPPFTWALAPASNPLPTGLSLASDGTISGTPTAAGTFDFTVQVTDSQPVITTANLSITVGNPGLLTGDYAFEFSGFDSSGGVVVAGSFTADGAGNITSGVEDFNTIAGPPKTQTFTGTYTVGSDGRGALIFSSLTGSPTYALAIDSTGSHGRLIQFDASGIRGSGQLEKRSVSTCASNTIDGNWAFGITGQEIAAGGASAGPAVIAGSFVATPPATSSGQGSLGPGEADASTTGGVTRQNSLSGTFQTTSQSTRCTMTVTPSSLASLTFSVYPVTSSEAFLVETDTVNSTTPFLTTGQMRAQVGAPFLGTAGSTFTSTTVAGLAGSAIPSGGTSYLPYAAIVELNPTGLGGFTMPLVGNFGGTIVSDLGLNAVTGNFGTGDQYGRVDTNLTVPIEPVFYVVGPNEAFCILEATSSAVLGIFEPKSAGPFTASMVNGSFAYGTAAPGMAAPPDFSGVVTLANTTTTAGAVDGSQDTSTSSANTAGQTVTGTYSITDQTAGVGTFTLTAPSAFTGQFFIVSPTKLAMISTTGGDRNPVLIFLGN
jgi:hypothetical protein